MNYTTTTNAVKSNSKEIRMWDNPPEGLENKFVESSFHELKPTVTAGQPFMRSLPANTTTTTSSSSSAAIQFTENSATVPREEAKRLLLPYQKQELKKTMNQLHSYSLQSKASDLIDLTTKEDNVSELTSRPQKVSKHHHETREHVIVLLDHDLQSKYNPTIRQGYVTKGRISPNISNLNHQNYKITIFNNLVALQNVTANDSVSFVTYQGKMKNGTNITPELKAGPFIIGNIVSDPQFPSLEDILLWELKKTLGSSPMPYDEILLFLIKN